MSRSSWLATHTQTQIDRHTDTQTHTHTHRGRHTHRHTHARRQSPLRSRIQDGGRGEQRADARACRRHRSRDVSASDLPGKIRDVGQGLLAVEELRRPEALSLLNIKNAIKAFREEGLLDIRPHQGGLQVDESAYDYYIHDLRNLLP